MKLCSDSLTLGTPDRQPIQLPPWFGTAYVLTVFALGGAAIAASVSTLLDRTGHSAWLALAVLTLLAGSFALKVPRVPATVSVSEVFVFATIMLFGWAPATLTVAADGLITSLRGRNRRVHRLLFNIAEPAVSVCVASAVYAVVSANSPLANAASPFARLLLPVIAMSSTYFIVNSGLTTLAVMSETAGSPYQIWRNNFAWLSLNYFAGTSMALFLVLNAREMTLGSIAAALPLVVLLYCTFKAWIRRIEDSGEHLEQVNRLHIATVESLAMAVDARDQVTHGHIRRVQTYALALAERMRISDPAELKAIEVAALLHDTGKIAVPDRILNKPGKLTTIEYAWMKRHPVIGADILSAVDFPYPVVPIVRSHHESWDGTGYPDGLRGTDIPLGARILSVVDCYDALTSDRPYRRALTHDEALDLVRQRRGSMYDPQVVDVFLELAPRLPTLAPLSQSVWNGPAGRALGAVAGTAHEVPAAGVETGIGELSGEVLRIGELATSLAGRAPFEDIAELLALHIRRLTPASLVAFYMADPAADSLSLTHASGPGNRELGDLHLRLGHGLSGWVAMTCSTMLNGDPSLDFGPRMDRLPERLDSALCVPLMAADTATGVLALYATGSNAFSTAHLRSMALVGGAIGAALTQARRTESDRAGARIDPETGLPNARYLQALLADDGWLEQAGRHGRLVVSIRLGLPLLRFDKSALVQAIDAVRETVRGGDLMFRTGSQELLLLLSDTDYGTARRLSERISARLEAPDLPYQGAVVTFACAPEDGTRWEDLVAAAWRRHDDRTDSRPRVLTYATA